MYDASDPHRRPFHFEAGDRVQHVRWHGAVGVVESAGIAGILVKWDWPEPFPQASFVDCWNITHVEDSECAHAADAAQACRCREQAAPAPIA